MDQQDKIRDYSAPNYEHEKLQAEIEKLKAETNNLKKPRIGTWQQSLFIAVITGILGFTFNTYTVAEEARSALELQRQQADAARILEVIRISDPIQACENLQLLLTGNLIADTTIAEGVDRYIEDQEAREGRCAFLTENNSLSAINRVISQTGTEDDVYVIFEDGTQARISAEADRREYAAHVYCLYLGREGAASYTITTAFQNDVVRYPVPHLGHQLRHVVQHYMPAVEVEILSTVECE